MAGLEPCVPEPRPSDAAEQGLLGPRGDQQGHGCPVSSGGSHDETYVHEKVSKLPMRPKLQMRVDRPQGTAQRPCASANTVALKTSADTAPPGSDADQANPD